MRSELNSFLTQWKHPVLTNADLAAVLARSATQRHSLVKRLLKKGSLIALKRGIYLVGKPYNQESPDTFAIAPLLYGPSYISFESALSHHGWIPEAVYATTSATTKRHKEFHTDIGRFVYDRTPLKSFLLGVGHITDKTASYFLAEPWKAVADLCYSHRKQWARLADLTEDLRIEIEDIQQSNLQLLYLLSEHYASRRVRHVLKLFCEELR